jgi:hypothetical protein
LLCAPQRLADRLGEVRIPESIRVSEAKERSVGVERRVALSKDTREGSRETDLSQISD